MIARLLLLLALYPAAARAEKPRPIVETHIHVYQVTRPGGVPWPKPGNQVLYRDVLPAEYRAMAQKQGVVAAGIMEASPIFEDNLKVAALIEKDPFFTFYVAQLEVGGPDFAAQLAQLVKSPKCVGIRAFLWSPKLTLEPRQIADLKALAREGMTLDLISRGDLNPKTQIWKLAKAVPELRIVIDHLGGAKGPGYDPVWEGGISTLASRPNVYMKVSSLFDIYNPRSSEDQGWSSPATLADYKPFLDVVLKHFGPDRLIFGSNWPVVNLGGSFENEVALVEEWLRPLGREVRDKVMYRNAQKFYRRVPPAR